MSVGVSTYYFKEGSIWIIKRKVACAWNFVKRQEHKCHRPVTSSFWKGVGNTIEKRLRYGKYLFIWDHSELAQGFERISTLQIAFSAEAQVVEVASRECLGWEDAPGCQGVTAPRWLGYHHPQQWLTSIAVDQLEEAQDTSGRSFLFSCD